MNTADNVFLRAVEMSREKSRVQTAAEQAPGEPSSGEQSSGELTLEELEALEAQQQADEGN